MSAGLGVVVGLLYALSPAARAQESLACTPPKILSRKDWGAKPPAFAMRPQTQQGIVIHHSGMPQYKKLTFTRYLQIMQKDAQTPQTLDTGLKRPAWADLAYHFIVNWDGQIAEARSIDFAGDTNTHYDPTHRILIDVEGDFEKIIPSKAQVQALTQLIAYLTNHYKISAQQITGHRDETPATDCPGRNLYAKLPQIIASASRICP